MARTRSTSKRRRLTRERWVQLDLFCECQGAVETNRTELLPGPLQVLGQGNGMNDAEQDSKTSTPP